MRTKVDGIEAEFDGAGLGDARLSKRLTAIGRALARNVGESVPKAMGSDAATEAAYRFFSNESVDPDGILEPHFTQTAARCREAKRVYVASDSSKFEFSTPRDGVGRIVGNKRHGFVGHLSLAVSLGKARKPLGVIGFRPINRTGPKKTSERSRERKTDPNNENRRWREQALEVQARLGPDVEAVHVMDRESDSFELFEELTRGDVRFVTRVQSNRLLDRPRGEGPRLFVKLQEAEVSYTTTAHLSARKKKPTTPRRLKEYPPRQERTADLEVSAIRLSIPRPRGSSTDLPEKVELNYVHVSEPKPPLGEPAVDWKLATNEPIDTPEQVEAIVEAYRARWVIEEYFKALKSGTGFERAQLESYEALLNLLATLMPIAWRALSLRSAARQNPDGPAEHVLPPLWITILRKFSTRKLSTTPTLQEAMLAVAGLGGHLKQNGAPGWKTLMAGVLEVERLVEGWEAALASLQEK